MNVFKRILRWVYACMNESPHNDCECVCINNRDAILPEISPKCTRIDIEKAQHEYLLTPEMLKRGIVCNRKYES